MLSTFSLSDPADLFTVVVGGILLLKRVAEIDRYHKLRVFVLTSILSCIVIYLVLEYGLTVGDSGCLIVFEEY